MSSKGCNPTPGIAPQGFYQIVNQGLYLSPSSNGESITLSSTPCTWTFANTAGTSTSVLSICVNGKMNFLTSPLTPRPDWKALSPTPADAGTDWFLGPDGLATNINGAMTYL